MPGQVRPKEIIDSLHKLSEKDVCEMYATLYQRAFETNPLKSWTFTLNPTRQHLAEVLEVLPPSDMEDIQERWFPR